MSAFDVCLGSSRGRCGYLDKAQAALGEFAGLDPQIRELSRENRKPRSASAERFSFGRAEIPEVVCVNSSTTDGAIARLASRKSMHCSKVSAWTASRKRLQNRPMSRDSEQQAPHDLHTARNDDESRLRLSARRVPPARNQIGGLQGCRRFQ